MELKIKLDEADLGRLRRELRWMPGAGPKAMCAALNKTVAGARTDVTRSVAGHYLVTQADARKTLSLRKASRSHLEAAVRSDGSPIRLIKFRVSPKSVSGRRPSGGVKVTVKKGEGGRIRGGFIAAMGNGSVGVFVRTGSSRLPIKQLYGPAIPSMVKQAGVFDEIQASAEKRLMKNLEHEVYRIVRGFGR